MNFRKYGAIQVGLMDVLKFSMRRQTSLLGFVVLVALFFLFLLSTNRDWSGIVSVASILVVFIALLTVAIKASAVLQWRLTMEKKGFWVETVRKIGTSRFFVEFSQLQSIKPMESSVSLYLKNQDVPILIGCVSNDIVDAVHFLSIGLTQWNAIEKGS